MLTRTLSPSNRPLLMLLRDPAFKRAAWLGAGYFAWVLVYRLLTLSFVTYIVTISSDRPPGFEDVTEALSANGLWLTALGSLLFLGLVQLLNPLPDRANPLSKPSLTRKGIRQDLIPGLAQGGILGAGIVAACLISGVYHYLGFFVHFEQVLLAAANVLLRVASLVVLVHCDERIFREGILLSLRDLRLSDDPTNWTQRFAVAALTTFAFVGSKAFQFDLGTAHYVTLALLSLALSLRVLSGRGPLEGAGLWASLLLVFHPLFGLPVLGNEFAGIILIKYQATESGVAEMMRFLTGGAGGPLSGFALQFLLILDMIRTGLRLPRN